jgi:Ca2+/Na+ antiporter
MFIRLFDIDTATALAQILPVILLALMVELRRTKIHRRGRRQGRTRALMGVFFILFALIETILVLSIDGRVYPFRWSDLVAALIIFALLLMLFVLTFLPEFEEDRRRREHGADPERSTDHADHAGHVDRAGQPDRVGHADRDDSEDPDGL